MHYVETQPPPDSPLAPYVRCYWSLDTSLSNATETIPPDGAVELIFHFGDRFEQCLGGQLVPQPLSLLVAELRRPVVVRPSGNGSVFGIRFRLGGAYPFLKHPLDELRDEIHDLSVVDQPFAALRDQLGDLRSHEERVLVADRALRAVLLQHSARIDARIDRAVAWMRAQRRNVSVDELGHLTGTTSRTLERRFNATVGLGPRATSRLLRFHFTLAAFLSGRRELVDVALDRYFDQSHLVNDFRAFAGAPPMRYLGGAHTLSDLFTT